ncbi:MAG: deoxyribodipyrimidine photo-lyase [Burkholderiales bacterium]|nr:deoxyribodipyrimidine photo-lyase [Burkholderiales bacterium]
MVTSPPWRRDAPLIATKGDAEKARLAPVDRALVWLRRDLRLTDHRPLAAALRSARQVWCLFVFDSDILAHLPRADRRVAFIHASLVELDADLRAAGGGLIVRHGHPVDEVLATVITLGVQQVHAGRDYEPDAVTRDQEVAARLAERGASLWLHKDQVIFDTDELLTGAGKPYGVFTPYKNSWLKRVDALALAEAEVAPHLSALAPVPDELANMRLPSLEALGFKPVPSVDKLQPGASGAAGLLADFLPRLDRYGEARDFPAIKGPSYLSVHLRFGTVSIRQLARLAHSAAYPGNSPLTAVDNRIGAAVPGSTAAAGAAAGDRGALATGPAGAATWLGELIWRDFYFQVLHHQPWVGERCFKPEFDAVAWDEGPEADALFAAWCAGRTGYPLVDAAMRQLNQTGYMHNRLRMVAASFLTKDLGIAWQRGERYFALMLNDYDLAANCGGWQWAASTGCDAQPWFRIFNPLRQSEKFDPQGRFIRRYLPELAGLSDKAIHAPWLASPLELQAAGVVPGGNYPLPVVDHEQARARTLARFKAVRGEAPRD